MSKRSHRRKRRRFVQRLTKKRRREFESLREVVNASMAYMGVGSGDQPVGWACSWSEAVALHQKISDEFEAKTFGRRFEDERGGIHISGTVNVGPDSLIERIKKKVQKRWGQ